MVLRARFSVRRDVFVDAGNDGGDDGGAGGDDGGGDDEGEDEMTSVVAIDYCYLLSLVAWLLAAISIHNILLAIYVKCHHYGSLNCLVFKNDGNDHHAHRDNSFGG